MTHICVGNVTIIGPDNGLWPSRHQAIIWTNAGILLNGPWGTNSSEILIGIHTFSFKKIHLKMLSAKWRPFCLSLNVLTFLGCRSTHYAFSVASSLVLHIRTNSCVTIWNEICSNFNSGFALPIDPYNGSENHTLKMIATSPRGPWVKCINIGFNIKGSYYTKYFASYLVSSFI